MPMAGDDRWFDPDIAAMSLRYEEKSGLQLYRNYTKAFEAHAVLEFRKSLVDETLDLSNFKRLVGLLVAEDIRFVPVVVCGYADELIQSAFRSAIPENVPGGLKEMMSGYGPLSDLSKRIRMAFAFDVLSPDLMEGFDKIRKVRNRISHDWDIKAAADLINHPVLSGLYPIEADLSEAGVLPTDLGSEAAFRVRVIWLAGRLTYEEAVYGRAKKARLDPGRALYEDGGTPWLREISRICMRATRDCRN